MCVSMGWWDLVITADAPFNHIVIRLWCILPKKIVFSVLFYDLDLKFEFSLHVETWIMFKSIIVSNKHS